MVAVGQCTGTSLYYLVTAELQIRVVPGVGALGSGTAHLSINGKHVAITSSRVVVLSHNIYTITITYSKTLAIGRVSVRLQVGLHIGRR